MSLEGNDGRAGGGGSGGGGDFLSIAALLADPVRLQAEYRKIAEARAQADATIALVGPAEEILSLREAARASLADASEAVSRADTEARRTLDEAVARAGEILAAANEEASRLKADARAAIESAMTKFDEARAAQAEAAAIRDELATSSAKKMGELDDALIAARNAQEAASKAEARFNALSAVIAEHSSLLQEKLNAVGL